MIYQLTYKENEILVWKLVYDYKTGDYRAEYQETRGMPANNMLQEGWGIAYQKPVNSTRLGEIGLLYATDGSHNIYSIDPLNWETVRTIPVKDQQGQFIENLNELEFVTAHPRYIFANQFLYNNIHMIDLQTGNCVKTWNLKELL